MRISWLQSLSFRPDPRVGWWFLAAYSTLALLGVVAANRLTSWLEWTAVGVGALFAAPHFLGAWLHPHAATASQGLLDAVFQGSPLPIFALDRQGIVQRYWNLAAQRRFGLPPAKALGKPMPVVLAGFKEELARHLDRVFQGESIPDIQGQGLAKAGPSFPLNLSMTPVFGPGGKVEAALVILADDASQKARIATLASLLGEKAALLDAVRSAGIVLWAMDPHSGRVVHASSAALEVLGLSRERVVADAGSLVRLLGPGDREKFKLARSEALAGHVGSFEAPLAPTGRWTRWTLDLSGGLLRGVVQDITEARALQEQLLQSQKLETVGEFLSTVTHDFNNILMSILGYNELMLLDPDLRPDQKRRLEVMQRGASRGQALASRLLRYARKGAAVRVETDLNELVGEVVALLEEANTTPVYYQTDLDPDLPATLVEPSELHQVIMNLGINARDAMPEGGEVTFRTRVAGPAEAAALGFGPAPVIVLEIADTGQGIPSDLRERIFDPFFTTKAEGKGTGLGLAVVHRIVNAHGGMVTFSSREGEGTVFRVLLPLSSVSA